MEGEIIRSTRVRTKEIIKLPRLPSRMIQGGESKKRYRYHRIRHQLIDNILDNEKTNNKRDEYNISESSEYDEY